MLYSHAGRAGLNSKLCLRVLTVGGAGPLGARDERGEGMGCVGGRFKRGRSLMIEEISCLLGVLYEHKCERQDSRGSSGI